MAGKTFKDLIREAKESDEFWIADAIISFTEALHNQAERKGISRADFARAVGVSNAYITKIFRGNTNFTIGTMVKLARSVKARISVHLSPEEAEVRWFDVIKRDPMNITTSTTSHACSPKMEAHDSETVLNKSSSWAPPYGEDKNDLANCA